MVLKEEEEDQVAEWRDQESWMTRNGIENDDVLDQKEGGRIDQNEWEDDRDDQKECEKIQKEDWDDE